MAIEVSDINPFSKFDIGVGQIGNILILFAIATAILGCVGWLIYWRITSRQYKFFIPLYKSISGTNLRIAMYRAKNVPISLAGDSLWFVKGVKRFIAPATLTDAPNSYPHEEREDGEWINFSIASVNDEQKKAGVKFIHQDMRTQRIATGQILEQRLINKGFWEKYKDMIIHLIFYLIVTMLLIVTFWQWGNIVEKVGSLLNNAKEIVEGLNNLECIGNKPQSIIPTTATFLPFLFLRRKK